MVHRPVFLSLQIRLDGVSKDWQNLGNLLRMERNDSGPFQIDGKYTAEAPRIEEVFEPSIWTEAITKSVPAMQDKVPLILPTLQSGDAWTTVIDRKMGAGGRAYIAER